MSQYLIRAASVRSILDQRHCSHQRAAQALQLSRSYWSQLCNRRRTLTPEMRHRMLSCPLFKDIPEDQLWERVESP